MFYSRDTGCNIKNSYSKVLQMKKWKGTLSNRIQLFCLYFGKSFFDQTPTVNCLLFHHLNCILLGKCKFFEDKWLRTSLEIPIFPSHRTQIIVIQQITMLLFHPQLFTWTTVSSMSTGVFSEKRVRLHRLLRTGYEEIRTVSCINPLLPGGRDRGCGVKLCWGQEGFIS